MPRSAAEIFAREMDDADLPPFVPIEAYEIADGKRAPDRSEPCKADAYVWREPSAMPRRPWIYGRQILRRSVFNIIAPGATGKTTWSVGTALALTTGRDFMDQPVWGGPQRVWVWNLEDTKDELAYAIQAGAMHWDITEADLGGRLHLNSGPDGSRLRLAMQTPAGARIDREVSDALISELTEKQIDVLIIDPFVSSHGLPDENDNAAIDMVAKEWARIANVANCAVILSHHSRKLNGGEVTAESSRGASSLTDAARGGLALNRMSEADALEFGIDAASRRRFFRADDAKPNRAPPGEATWFEIVSVHLGNGPDGGDSVGVAVPWKAPDPFEDVSTHHLRLVQMRIDERGWRESPQANDWFGILVADVLGLDLDVKKDKAKVKSIARTWITNGAFALEERPDTKRQLRKFVVLGEAV